MLSTPFDVILFGQDDVDLSPPSFNIVSSLGFEDRYDENCVDISDVDVVFVNMQPDQDTRMNRVSMSFPETPVIRISEDGRAPRTFSYGEGCQWFSASTFDASVPEEHIDSVEEFIVDYYRLAAALPIEDTDTLGQLVDVPERSFESIEEASPLFALCSQSNTFWRGWILERLLSVPGPLMNRTRLAARIGVTPDALRRREHKLRPAQYSGVFSDWVDRQWWVRGVSELLDGIEFSDEEKASCARCERTGVDRAARYSEGDMDFLVPVHYRCSNITQDNRKPFQPYREVPTGKRPESAMEKLYRE